MPPPTTADDFAADGFDQLGFRVPGLVVGPWVSKQVSDVVFDHASIYATIAALHDLEPLGARDAAANTLLSLLDEGAMAKGNPRAGVELAPIVADEAEIFADECKGFAFHRNDAEVGRGAITGQAELERAFVARFPDAARNLRAATDGSMRDLLARARQQGVWLPKV